MSGLRSYSHVKATVTSCWRDDERRAYGFSVIDWTREHGHPTYPNTYEWRTQRFWKDALQDIVSFTRPLNADSLAENIDMSLGGSDKRSQWATSSKYFLYTFNVVSLVRSISSHSNWLRVIIDPFWPKGAWHRRLDVGHLHPRRMDHQALHPRTAGLPNVDGSLYSDGFLRLDHLALLLRMLGRRQWESLQSVRGAYDTFSLSKGPFIVRRVINPPNFAGSYGQFDCTRWSRRFYSDTTNCSSNSVHSVVRRQTDVMKVRMSPPRYDPAHWCRIVLPSYPLLMSIERERNEILFAQISKFDSVRWHQPWQNRDQR